MSDKITNIFGSIRRTIQIDHLTFKKVRDSFEKYPFDDEFLCDVFYNIHKLLDELTYLPKMGIKNYLMNKFKEIYSEDFIHKLIPVFERRQPIFIPHNGHRFMRNRKMNLRSIYEYAVLSYIASHYFTYESIQNGITSGGLPISGIRHTLKTSNSENDSVMLFDIFSCFENVSCKDIKTFLETDNVKLTNYGVKYALTLLDSDLPMYMDNEFDKFFVKKYIDILTDRFVLNQKDADLFQTKKIIGVDEILFYFGNKAFTGKELHRIEKQLDRFICLETNGKLKLNKSKSKLLNKDNIDEFVNDVLIDYTEYKNFGKFLSNFCYDFPMLSSEEILLKIKANPSLFKHLIREFENTKPDRSVYVAFKHSYETVFKGVVYNDLQLFFEKRVLGAKFWE